MTCAGCQSFLGMVISGTPHVCVVGMEISTPAQQKNTPPCNQQGGVPDGFIASSVRRRFYHRLELLDDARFDEDARLIGCNRHVEHIGEDGAFQVS